MLFLLAPKCCSKCAGLWRVLLIPLVITSLLFRKYSLWNYAFIHVVFYTEEKSRHGRIKWWYILFLQLHPHYLSPLIFVIRHKANGNPLLLPGNGSWGEGSFYFYFQGTTVDRAHAQTLSEVQEASKFNKKTLAAINCSCRVEQWC